MVQIFWVLVNSMKRFKYACTYVCITFTVFVEKMRNQIKCYPGFTDNKQLFVPLRLAGGEYNQDKQMFG